MKKVIKKIQAVFYENIFKVLMKDQIKKQPLNKRLNNYL